eukprot:gene3293-22364_t
MLHYDANQMGDEVKNPRHVIPRAGVTTACVVTLIFLAVYPASAEPTRGEAPERRGRKVQTSGKSQSQSPGQLSQRCAYMAVIAAVPWGGPDGFAQRGGEGDNSANYIMATFGEAVGGFPLACIFCILVILTIFGSCFAQLLGYSMIPYTAAKEGYFPPWFAHEHPTKRGKNRSPVADHSLMAVGGVALVGCWLPLEMLISAMVTSLVLSQFQ